MYRDGSITRFLPAKAAARGVSLGPSPARPLYRVTNQVWTFDCVTKSRRTISLSRGSFNRRFLFGKSLRRPNSRPTSHVLVSSHATLPARPSARRTTRTRPPRPRPARVSCAGGGAGAAREKKSHSEKSRLGGKTWKHGHGVYLKSLRITKTYEKKRIFFVTSANRENRHGETAEFESCVSEKRAPRRCRFVRFQTAPLGKQTMCKRFSDRTVAGRTGGPKAAESPGR